MLPCVGDAVLPEMEDRRGQHGISATGRQTFTEMIEVPRATGGDDRDVDRRRDGFQQGEVIAIAGTIAVHAGEQDLPSAAARRFSGPGHDVETAGAPPAVGVDTPAIAIRLTPGVDGDDDALPAEDLCPGVDEIGIADG